MLAESTYADVRAIDWQAALLPFGATEPHNLHLPYGTDTFQVEALARRAGAWAWQRGARVAVLPTMPFGVNTNYLQLPRALTCSVTPTTLLAILSDLMDSLYAQGLRKLVLLNGHGGNELKPLVRQLYHKIEMFVCVCDWYRMAADLYPSLFEQPGEHADEVETSLGLAFFPHLVHLDRADAGTARLTRFEAINRGWVSITRPWHLATTNTGLGDPRAATAEKGQRLMDALTQRLGDFLVELAGAPLDATFPYLPADDTTKA
ncbi:MAG: creatininase family protein [Gemmataceae bacterium]